MTWRECDRTISQRKSYYEAGPVTITERVFPSGIVTYTIAFIESIAATSREDGARQIVSELLRQAEAAAEAVGLIGPEIEDDDGRGGDDA